MMFSQPLFAVAAAALVASGCATERNARIVNGFSVSIEEHPYMAQLHLTEAGGAKHGRQCSGTLIAPTWLVTAAHCVDGLDAVYPGRAIVGTAENCFPSHSQTCDNAVIIDIKRVIPHPSFNLCNMRNDIALIELIQPASKTVGPMETVFDPVNVSKTMIADGATLTEDEKSTYILGWGATQAGAKGPALLTKMRGEYLTQSGLAAADQFSAHNSYPIEVGMIGAHGLPSIKGAGDSAFADYCTGDAGGPLINTVTNQLVGIVSFGADCNVHSIPGVYTNIPFYYDWLTQHVGGLASDPVLDARRADVAKSKAALEDENCSDRRERRDVEAGSSGDAPDFCVSIQKELVAAEAALASHTSTTDVNGAATDVNLGDPEKDTKMCKSNLAKIIGIAVGATLGAILLIVLIVVCTKKHDTHFFKGVVRRVSKVFKTAAVAPAGDGTKEDGGSLSSESSESKPDEAAAEEGTASGPPASPTDANSAESKVQSKGPCSKCGKPVLVTQEREKNDDGTYKHAKTCPDQ